jgi:hypothetical protein
MNNLLSLPMLSKEFAGNTILDWMIALAIVFVIVVLLFMAISLVRHYALKRSLLRYNANIPKMANLCSIYFVRILIIEPDFVVSRLNLLKVSCRKNAVPFVVNNCIN